MSAITYRITDLIDHMLQAEHLQQVVWGTTPLDTLSATTMRWMLHIGGLLIGAWDDDTMIGFCVASVGKRDGKPVLWSDMAGIHPEYQGQGIGQTLKFMQREWAKREGYEEIRWTFDPMRRGNAFFNFHKLGVTSNLYHPAFYGEMQDNINKGLPADRLEAIWKTTKTSPTPSVTTDNPMFLVKFENNDLQVTSSNDKIVAIEIPYDLDHLKATNLSLAVKWQQAVRESFLQSFKAGYRTIDFLKQNERCWYILSQ